MIHCYVDQCSTCDGGMDSTEHILFYCSFAKSYWDMLQSKLGFKFSYMPEWPNGGWLREGE